MRVLADVVPIPRATPFRFPEPCKGCSLVWRGRAFDWGAGGLRLQQCLSQGGGKISGPLSGEATRGHIADQGPNKAARFTSGPPYTAGLASPHNASRGPVHPPSLLSHGSAPCCARGGGRQSAGCVFQWARCACLPPHDAVVPRRVANGSHAFPPRWCNLRENVQPTAMASFHRHWDTIS